MAYVYSHIRNDNGKCFYIGKGTGNRAYDFNQRSYNKHWSRVATKAGVDVVILIDNISDEKALELETSFIDQIGLKNLTNMQEGGQGGWGHLSYHDRTKGAKKAAITRKWYKPSEETKLKTSISMKGKNTGPKPEGFGKKVSENRGHLYKELSTGFVGRTSDIQEHFGPIHFVSIWGNAQHDRPFTRGKNKGLNFIKI